MADVILYKVDLKIKRRKDVLLIGMGRIIGLSK
jgi:hypothetical protein